LHAVGDRPVWSFGSTSPAALAFAIVEASNDAIFAKTLDGVVLSWNGSAERIYGYRADEMVGRHLSVLVPEPLAGELSRLLSRVAGGDLIEDYETVRRTKDGRLLDVSITVSPIHDESGTVVGASTIARDITERKRRERSMQHRALHDPLTDLANRAFLFEQLRIVLARATRHSSRVGVLFIDLDSFKQVNDTYGHQTGDEVLRAVAHRIRRAVRDEDTVARLGGDEFLVVCSDVANARDVHSIAERIEHLIEQPLDVVGGAELVVRGSIGVSVSEGGDDARALIEMADAAMYRRKTARRS
jgi:diguanylate cyclase (GGDEF)-like protein/PAS domain S-box-containing protein